MSSILENHQAAAFAILSKAKGLSAVEYFLVRYAIKSQFEAASKASAEEVPELLNGISSRISALANKVFKRDVEPYPPSNDMAYVIDQMREITSANSTTPELPNAYQEQTETPAGWEYRGPSTPEGRHPQLKPCNLSHRHIIEFSEKFRSKVEHDDDKTKVQEILEALGGKVIEVSWGDPCIAHIRDKGDFDVFVSDTAYEEYKRWIIARVLGHYALHFLWPNHQHNAELSDIRIKDTNPSSRANLETNVFANALLLPMDSVFKFLEKEGGDLRSYVHYAETNMRPANAWFSAIMQNAL